MSSDLEYSNNLSPGDGPTDPLQDPVNSLHGKETTSLQIDQTGSPESLDAIPEMRGREIEIIYSTNCRRQRVGRNFQISIQLVEICELLVVELHPLR